MTFKSVAFLMLAGACVAALAATPDVAVHQNRSSGVVVSYVANSGTNTSIDVSLTNAVPFRLREIDAYNSSGTATSVTVSRVWSCAVPRLEYQVITNFFGTVETNGYWRGYQETIVTNSVYDSSTDAYPTNAFFLRDEGMTIDFGSVTGAVVRIIGTAE